MGGVGCTLIAGPIDCVISVLSMSINSRFYEVFCNNWCERLRDSRTLNEAFQITLVKVIVDTLLAIMNYMGLSVSIYPI